MGISISDVSRKDTDLELREDVTEQQFIRSWDKEEKPVKPFQADRT